MTDDELQSALVRTRRPDNWSDGLQWAERSMTPGIFYHGSPHVNIPAFENGLRISDVRQTDDVSLQTSGVFFTEDPTVAAIMLARLTDGLGGRIYSAEIDSRNTYVCPADWVDDDLSRQAESALIAGARAEGYDTIVSKFNGEVVGEIIVLDADVIRRRDDDVRRLGEWQRDQAENLTFFECEGVPGPDYAPECALLFGNQKFAPSTLGRTVLVNASHPIYCERSAWPRMNFEVLRNTRIGCLIDPRDGGALVIHPETIIPLNRKMKRELKSRARRR